MTRTFTVTFLTLSMISLGQTPEWTQLKIMAGKETDQGTAIQIDKNNNYYVIGIFNNVDAPGPDSVIVDCKPIPPPRQNAINGFLFRYDSTKALTLTLTISNGLIGQTVVDNDGNIIVSGAINYGATRDGFLRKYDRSGNIIWTKYIKSYRSSSDDDVITSLDISPDGSMVICGFSYGDQVSIFGNLINGPSNFVVKLNDQSNISWIHHFSSTLGRGAYRAKFDKKGDVLLAGNEEDVNTNKQKALIAKISGTSGSLRWKKVFESTGNYVPWFRAIGTYNDSYMFGGEFGGELKVGNSTFNSLGNLDFLLLKTDTSGNPIWVKQGGSAGKDRLYNLICDTNAVTYITGGFSDGFKYNSFPALPAKGNTDAYVIAVDSTGEAIWQRHGGSNIAGHTNSLFYDEYGADISIDSKNQIQLIGTVIGSGNFGTLVFNAPEEAKQNAFWLTLGTSSSTDTVNYPCNKPAPSDNNNFVIYVHPNPFLGILYIDNSEHRMVKYDITLSTTLGQIVSKRIISTTTAAITEWNKLAKGIYFLTVQAADYKRSFKIVKM